MAKPKCSRNSSIEAFLVGVKFKGKLIAGLKQDQLNLEDALTTLNHLDNFKEIYFGNSEEDLSNENHVVKFIACGKNEILDADMNYSLD